MSVLAFQVRTMVLVVELDLARPVGTDGGVVSGGGGALLTVTVMLELIVILPAASWAMAVRVWLPLLSVVVSQTVEYGAVVSSAPWLPPSIVNWTPATPTLSLAVAVIETLLPDTVAPLVGAVRETVGTELSTVTVTVLLVVVLPALSVVTAVKVWLPLLAVVVSQLTL